MSVREERFCPLDDWSGEAHGMQGEEELAVVNVVKKAFDVYGEKGGGVAPVQGELNVVGEGEASIDARRSHNSSELFRRHEGKFGAVEHKATSDRFFHKLA